MKKSSSCLNTSIIQICMFDLRLCSWCAVSRRCYHMPTGWWAGGKNICIWWTESSSKLPVAVTLGKLLRSTEAWGICHSQLWPFWKQILPTFALFCLNEGVLTGGGWNSICEVLQRLYCSGTKEEVSLSLFTTSPPQEDPDRVPV